MVLGGLGIAGCGLVSVDGVGVVAGRCSCGRVGSYLVPCGVGCCGRHLGFFLFFPSVMSRKSWMRGCVFVFVSEVLVLLSRR